MARSTHTDRDFPQAGHDHAACIDEALAAAAEVCRLSGARLTELRRQVLLLIWDSHAPVGAYQLLDKLSRDGRTAAPPTIYRALDFLSGQGLIHRIESLNAYVGCRDPRRPHVGQFLICRECGTAAELEDAEIAGTVRARCADADFEMHHLTLEVLGRCPGCRRTGPGQADR
ncbi:MAG: Fur family transcriptional regulator [Alphaproteobacteria bacterium]|nr:Fur family transcriptional regulator [Alphaproteobacteria bacterium]